MSELSDVLALSDPADGVTRGHLTPGWLIGGAINGGILMALGAKAMAQAVSAGGGQRDVVAFSAYFLSASEPGPVELRPDVLRVGRNFSTAQVSVLQD